MDWLNDAEECWTAVCERERSADGAFVYAVATTRIYCRPTCSSRRPRREHVQFFALPAAAEAAGYRPCKRCHPRAASLVNPHARLAQEICEYVDVHIQEPARLTGRSLAQHFHYHADHLQEIFRSMLKISIHQYVDLRRTQFFKGALRESATVTDAIYAAGYQSSSRVYERSQEVLGMSPAQYRAGAPGVVIGYTLAETPFGLMLVAMTARGICAVGLYDEPEQAEAALRAEYPQAVLERAEERLNPIVQQIVEHIGEGSALDLPLDIRATAFQRRVWDALRRIPRGETRSYSEVAEAIGQPSAVRAVAHACASNAAAIVIPCHRVLGKDGRLSGYRWGVERKEAILAAEGALRLEDRETQDAPGYDRLLL